MIKFPSIEQFRNVCKSIELRASYRGDDSEGRPIYEKSILPVLEFRGTVKIHGTNAAVVVKNDEHWFQSRERVISPGDDNFGFAAFAANNMEYFQEACRFIRSLYNCETVAFFGEWCGKGIAKGVAVSELERMFVIFKVKADDKWIDLNPSFISNNLERRIFNINSFGEWNIVIDFNNPGSFSNDLVAITNEVERECPVGKYFGVSGVGEGVVWSPVDDVYIDDKFIFKVKGEKHSVSNVKTLSLVDVQKLDSIKECVDAILPENRLERGLAYLNDVGKSLDIKNIGEYIKWVTSDAIKEEMDTITNSGFTPKDISKELTNKAKNWFIEKLKVL
jgi:hypothetical protein